MSTELPDPTEAYDFLFQNIHSEVFMNKLAAAGIVPQNEQEVRDLFTLAGNLRHVQAQKQASAQSRFSSAVSYLDGALSSDENLRWQAKQTESLAIKQAASQLAVDPAIYNAVLSLKLKEAEVMAGNQ